MIWKIVLPSNKSYILPEPPTTYTQLKEIVKQKYDINRFGHFCLKYIDAEDEFINLSTPEDFETAILSSKEENLRTLQIFVMPKIKNQPDFYSNQQTNDPVYYSCKDNDSSQSEYEEPSKRKEAKRRWTQVPSQLITKQAQKKSPRLNPQTASQYQSSWKYSRKLNRNLSAPPSSLNITLDEMRKAFLYAYGARLKKHRLLNKSMKGNYANLIKQVTEEKIEKKVEKEIKKAIPKMMPQFLDVLKEEFTKNKRTPQKEELPQPRRKFMEKNRSQTVCFQCQKPSQSVKCICEECAKNKLKEGPPMISHAKSQEDKHPHLRKDRNNTVAVGSGANQNQLFSHLALRRNPLRKECEDYKVSLAKVGEEVLEVSSSHSYKVRFTLKNCGDKKWPEDVRLICINGLNKGNEKLLPSLEPGREITIELSLHAPKETGKYLSQWRVSYGKGKKHRSFGECLFEEIQVLDMVTCKTNEERTNKKNDWLFETPMKKKNFVRQEEENSKGRNTTERKNSNESTATNGSMGSEMGESPVPSKISCDEDRMKYAKFLNEVLPGDLEEKMNFVRKCQKDLTIFEVVEKYLITLSKTKGQMNKSP